MADRVIIVVPIYKASFDVFESIDIQQLFNILGDYDVCFAIPTSFNIQELGNDFLGKAIIERFPDIYYRSIRDYSRLCLNCMFYERFKKYEYMLIYQSDAFVFSDKLMDFVEMGYDYIGAPQIDGYFWKDYHVGNGGLSLRKIETSIKMLKQFDAIVKDATLKGVFCDYEDLFWGYCGYKSDVKFSVPAQDIASSFSAQDDGCDSFKLIKKNGLPMGTHKWVGSDYGFWKPIVEEYGYKLPAINDVQSNACSITEMEKRMLPIFLWKYKTMTKEEKNKVLSELKVLSFEEYFIWGKGIYGKRCRNILLCFGIRVCVFIDNMVDSMTFEDETPVVNPYDVNLNGKNLIIAIKGKEKEIENQIASMNISVNSLLSYETVIDGLMRIIKKSFPEIVEMARSWTRDELKCNGVLMEYYW